MNLLFKITVISLLSMTQVFAQMTSCELAQIIAQEIEEKKLERQSLSEIQQEKMKAQRIREGLVNNESEREILLLAEAMQSEIDKLKKDQIGNYVSGGLSVGTIVISGYFIRKMSATQAGVSFKRKLMRQLNPTGPRAGIRTLTNSVFFLSTVASMYVFYQIDKNQDEMKVLSDMIDQLNMIRDFSNQVQNLDDHIEEMQVSFEILLEQIVEERTGQWHQQTLTCF